MDVIQAIRQEFRFPNVYKRLAATLGLLLFVEGFGEINEPLGAFYSDLGWMYPKMLIIVSICTTLASFSWLILFKPNTLFIAGWAFLFSPVLLAGLSFYLSFSYSFPVLSTLALTQISASYLVVLFSALDRN
jgi:hypothetical protein